MKPIIFGPDGADGLQRAYRRSLIRSVIRVNWTHRGLRPNDVMVASYPRSGNLWLRFMLVALLRGDVSYEQVRNSAPYVGSHRRAPPFLPNGGRLIKTHEPYLRRYRRAIHVVRDPRDVMVSYFKFLLGNGKLAIPPKMYENEALDRFVDAFIGGRLDAHGTWNSHLASWVGAAASERADIISVQFDELRADPVGNLERIANWLDAEVSLADIRRAVEQCTIDRMRAATRDGTSPGIGSSPKLPSPVHEGRVGIWREVLDERQARKFDVFADGLQLMGYPIN